MIKERVQSVYCTLPYVALPNLMIEEPINVCFMWFNTFPPKSGVSTTLSPRAIITGTILNIKNQCCIPFEVYTQICKEESNSVATESTLGTICLGPVGNVQGTYKFMSLRASKLIIRGDSSEIPATQDIIKRVAQIAAKQQATVVDEHNEDNGGEDEGMDEQNNDM
eukprot:1751211-Ditylum_brightwellii.AAC.1